MKRMTVALLLPLLPWLGCGDDTHPANPDAMTDGRIPDGPMPDGSPFPAPPTLGAQIDRMGRPGINTALTDPFWNDGTRTLADHEMKQDMFNASSDPSMWVAQNMDNFKAKLAVYDALDTMCGNQIAAGAAGSSRYALLAGVLANDQLWVNTATGTCNQFLGVELKVVNPATPDDCGGRTLTADVIDIIYSALAVGATSGVSDGINSDADGNPSNTSFPFLGAPN